MMRFVLALLLATSVHASVLGGRVVEWDGAPVAGARISMIPAPGLGTEEPRISSVTDASGTFSLDTRGLPSGDYVISIEGSARPALTMTGWRFAVGPTPLPPDLVVQLPPPCRLEGKVFTSEGNDASGAIVHVQTTFGLWRATASVQADDEGRFAIDRLPSLKLALVEATTSVERSQVAEAWLEPGTRRIALTLRCPLATADDTPTWPQRTPNMTVRGRVRHRGRPVSNAVVRAFFVADDNVVTATRQDGSFDLPSANYRRIPAGDPALPLIVATSGELWGSASIAPGSTRVDVDLRRSEDLVIDAGEIPAGRLAVARTLLGHFEPRYQKVRADGTVRFPALPDGEWQVLAFAPDGRIGEVTLLHGADDPLARLAVHEPTTIECRDASGRPLSDVDLGMNVTFATQQPHFTKPWPRVATGPDGRASVVVVPTAVRRCEVYTDELEDLAHVTARRPGFAQAETEIHLRQTSDVPLTLTPSTADEPETSCGSSDAGPYVTARVPRVLRRILDERGKPIAGATVELRVTDADGRVLVPPDAESVGTYWRVLSNRRGVVMTTTRPPTPASAPSP